MVTKHILEMALPHFGIIFGPDQKDPFVILLILCISLILNYKFMTIRIKGFGSLILLALYFLLMPGT